MQQHTKFIETMNQHLPLLTQYIPIVARVHGKEHPEFHAIAAVFDAMVAAWQAGDTAQLERQLAVLRTQTGNYTVPADTCETYEAVFQMLGQIDHAYFSQG